MVHDAFVTAFETDGAVSFRARMNHVDGRLVTIEVRGRTLRDSEGPATRLVLISRDVSDTVAWEATLERSYSKTRAILDAAPDSIVVIDRDLMVLEASPGTERIYGFPRSERMGRSALAIVHPDDIPVVTGELERMFAEESDELLNYRFRARHADGHWMIVDQRDDYWTTRPASHPGGARLTRRDRGRHLRGDLASPRRRPNVPTPPRASSCRE